MAGSRRKQRYAASGLDPSWNLQENSLGEMYQFPSPTEVVAERPEKIHAQIPTAPQHQQQDQPSDIPAYSDALLSPRAIQTQWVQGQPSESDDDNGQPSLSISSYQQSQSQSTSRLDVLELPATGGSTPSRLSRDGDESTSTISSSAPSRSAKGKKKRYAKQHSADWLEEDYSAGPDLGPIPSSTSHHYHYRQQAPLSDVPYQPQQMRPLSSMDAQPSAQTTPSSILSIFRGSGHQTYSPGQDAPAIHPGAPSAYSPASPPTTAEQQQQQNEEQGNQSNHLRPIAEEHTTPQAPLHPTPPPPLHPTPPPPQAQPQALPSHTRRKGWSRLLRIGQ